MIKVCHFMKSNNFKQTFFYSRRSFIGAAASSAFAFTFVPSRVFGANSRLQVAGVGVGGKVRVISMGWPCMAM